MIKRLKLLNSRIEKFLGDNETKIASVLACLAFCAPPVIVFVLFFQQLFYLSPYGDAWKSRTCFKDKACAAVAGEIGARWACRGKMKLGFSQAGFEKEISTFTYCPSRETQHASQAQWKHEHRQIAIALKALRAIKAEPILVSAQCSYTKGQPLLETFFGLVRRRVFEETLFTDDEIYRLPMPSFWPESLEKTNPEDGLKS
ncbi:MAG: hypothetical protein HY747_11870 [Elusimicrobia bacterium]|nr:hypothetical protein [Elusimicrobiota bacterium]